MKKIGFSQRPKPRSYDEKFSVDAAFFGSREKFVNPIPKKMYIAVLGMLGGVALTGAILLVSGFWTVRDVTAEDGTFYTATVVEQYAGVQAGDKMLGFDSSAVVKRLKKGLPLLDEIKVRKGLDGELSVSFQEITEVYYTCHNANYYLIAMDDMEVLGVFSNPTEAKRVGAVYLGVPEAARVRVGEKLTFVNLPYEPDTVPGTPSGGASGGAFDYELETDEPEEEYGYVTAFLEILNASPLAERVTGMELGDRYDLWLVLDKRIRVRIGAMDELERKLKMIERSLSDRVEEGRDDGTLPAMVDVSDPARIIHRVSPDVELPWWAVD